MNFKILFFILVICSSFCSSCGVKGPPKKYPETAIDSYVQEYTGSEPTKEEIERSKNKPAIKP